MSNKLKVVFIGYVSLAIALICWFSHDKSYLDLFYIFDVLAMILFVISFFEYSSDKFINFFKLKTKDHIKDEIL